MVFKIQLTNLAKEVTKKFPNINDGGCCIFAALVAKELQHICPVRIIGFSSDSTNIDLVRPNILNNTCREWGDNGVDFNHIVVEINAKIISNDEGDKWHYDANGIFASNGSICIDKVQLKGSLSVKEAIELANNPEGWNRDFDRTDIPKLEKVINKYFNNEYIPYWRRLERFVRWNVVN